MPERKARLIIVCGLPGSGKTTHAKRLEEQSGAIRFCPDEWFEALSLDLYDEPRRAAIEALQWQLAQKLLQQGVSVIIEWGTWSREERDILRHGARDAGAAVELHYLREPEEVLFERIERRGAETPPIRRDQIAQWAQLIQEPTRDEAASFDRYVLLESGRVKG